MHFHFGQLIAHLAKTRNVRAGSVIGSGPVSNADERRGVACLAERRALEALAGNAPVTGYLRFGDTVQIEVIGRDGQSVFGAITQRVVGPGMAEAEADSGAEADAAAAAETHANGTEPPDDDPR
jgi:fumarylacetoacetate (FAA) hydrolase